MSARSLMSHPVLTWSAPGPGTAWSFLPGVTLLHHRCLLNLPSLLAGHLLGRPPDCPPFPVCLWSLFVSDTILAQGVYLCLFPLWGWTLISLYGGRHAPSDGPQVNYLAAAFHCKP